MTSARLREHYATKYEEEGSAASSLTPIPLRMTHPSDRLQAACAFIPDRLPSGADILELGAGDGLIAHSLAKGGVNFDSYTLGDLSQPRLEGLARRLQGDKYRFVYADADELTASISAKYDAIIMIALIEHLIDPVGSMANVCGALKPGGFVYIDTPNLAKWTRRVKLAFGRFPSTASLNEGLTGYDHQPTDLYDEGHLHYFTYRSLHLMLLQRCGFDHVDYVGYYPDNVLPWIGNLLVARRPQLFSDVACFAYT